MHADDTIVAISTPAGRGGRATGARRARLPSWARGRGSPRRSPARQRRLRGSARLPSSAEGSGPPAARPRSAPRRPMIPEGPGNEQVARDAREDAVESAGAPTAGGDRRVSTAPRGARTLLVLFGLALGLVAALRSSAGLAGATTCGMLERGRRGPLRRSSADHSRTSTPSGGRVLSRQAGPSVLARYPARRGRAGLPAAPPARLPVGPFVNTAR